jgi:CheY-like chemotaxis protein
LRSDDNVDAAQTLSTLIESWGHQVECVHGGRDALARIPGFGPEALLLDIGLPGMNGYDLARAVRQLPQADSCLLIAVTGYGDVEARQRSAQAGYDQHLTKPVDPDTLEQILAHHGSRRRRPP